LATGGAKKTSWIEPDPILVPVVLAIFDLFSQLKNYSSVATKINEEFGHLLKFKMKAHHIKKIISNEIYIGKARLHGEPKPVIPIISSESFKLCKSIAESVIQQHKPRVKRVAFELSNSFTTVKEGLYCRELGFMHLTHGAKVNFDGTHRKTGDEVMSCSKCPAKWRFNEKAVPLSRQRRSRQRGKSKDRSVQLTLDSFTGT
jgi:hypothetical protein